MAFVHDEPPPWADGEEWWACSEPERAYDPSVVYHAWCPWCMVKLKLDLTRDPEVRSALVEYLAGGGKLCDAGVLLVLGRAWYSRRSAFLNSTGREQP